MSVPPHWRQVRFDDVLRGWLAAGGVQEIDKRGRTFAVPETPEARYRLLAEQSQLFLRFIPACDWYRVRFVHAEDVLALRLIHEESWAHTGGDMERALGARADLSRIPTAHAERVRELATRSDLSALVDERVVLFGHEAGAPLSILDGNHRLLALAHRWTTGPVPLEPFHAFVGLSWGPCRWHGDAVKWVERPGLAPGERRFILNVW